METQPTPTDGASIHERLMSALEPVEVEANDSNLEEESTDAEQATHEVDDESISDELEVEAETEEVEAEADEGDEVDEGHSYELSEIAELIGFDEDKLSVSDDGKILVKTKIDGVEGEAALEDLWRSYQLKGHLDNQTQKTAELQKQLEAEKQRLAEESQAKLQQLEDLSSLAYQELVREYNSIDWNELRADDPAEYSAKLADFQRRQSEINTAYQQLQSERQRQQQEYYHKVEEILQEENAKLTNGKTIPGWDKPDVAAKEYSQVLDYGRKLGYSDDVLKSMQRHQDVQVLYKAMKYDEMQSKKPEVTKKVKKAPKIARPGQPASKQDARRKELDAAKKRIKTGESGAAAEWLIRAGKV